MPTRPETHRATTLARREALLVAAVEVVAERGVGGVTHRAIAERAGLPASTTTYFFASIDDLVLEALQHFVAKAVARFDAVTSALADAELTVEAAVDLFAEALLAIPEQETVAQFEAYLEVSRRPELRPQVEAALAAFERLARAALNASDVADPVAAARALLALVDGVALQRIVHGPRDDDAVVLRTSMRALLAGYS